MYPIVLDFRFQTSGLDRKQGGVIPSAFDADQGFESGDEAGQPGPVGGFNHGADVLVGPGCFFSHAAFGRTAYDDAPIGQLLNDLAAVPLLVSVVVATIWLRGRRLPVVVLDRPSVAGE